MVSTNWLALGSPTFQAVGVHLIVGVLVLLVSLGTSCGTRESNPSRGSPKSLGISGHERAAPAQNDHQNGHLHVVVRRDTTDTDPQDGAGFPLNDGLPPPGQSQPLPPFTNENTLTSAPSVAATQRPTTSDGNVAPLFSASFLSLLLPLATCHFLRQLM